MLLALISILLVSDLIQLFLLIELYKFNFIYSSII